MIERTIIILNLLHCVQHQLFAISELDNDLYFLRQENDVNTLFRCKKRCKHIVSFQFKLNFFFSLWMFLLCDRHDHFCQTQFPKITFQPNAIVDRIETFTTILTNGLYHRKINYSQKQQNSFFFFHIQLQLEKRIRETK